MIFNLVIPLLFIGVSDSLDERQDRMETLPKYYKRVGDGKKVQELVDHDGTGDFVKLVRLDKNNSDTLNVYIQGVVKNHVSPNYSKAKKADLVIWCYPTFYNHERHVFPNSKGRIFLHEGSSGIVVIANEHFVKRVSEKYNIEFKSL